MGLDRAAHLFDAPSSTSIDWQRCGNQFECAQVLLPLDYADPTGEQVRIALKRLPATGESEGSILINPGGPGESGIDLADSAEYIFGAEVLERYDIIGFDPRGVGASTHVMCVRPGERDPSNRDYDLDQPSQVLRMETDLHTLGDLCREHSGALLDHVDTNTVVQDLEALRVLLGEDTLNYLGFSYGTFIGARYADAYPASVGRMVLDGAVDPAIDYSTLTAQQIDAFDLAFARFVKACQAQSDCPFDPQVPVAEQQVLDLVDELDDDPAPSDAEDGQFAGWELTYALQTAMYSAGDWSWLASEIAEVEAGGDATELDEYGVYGGAASDLNYPYWYTAIDCTDYPISGTFTEAVDRGRAAGEESELFGADYAEAYCQAWPAKARTAPAPVHAEGAAPIVVIGTRFDPATPYLWAQSLADQLSSGVLLTYLGDGHTVYGGISDCVDGAVDSYFLTGVPPADGTVCR